MRALLRAVLVIPKSLFVSPRAALLSGVLAAAPVLAQTAPVKTFDLEQIAISPGGQHSLLFPMHIEDRGPKLAELNKGYGPDQPLDTNDNEAGRQKNRRTDFTSINE